MIPSYPTSPVREENAPGFADYIVTALSPALIMGLVGSLVFFLAEIFYSGKYDSNLRYTLFFYVFGIVLVSRIAISVDPGKSMMYGIFLSGACMLALIKFVSYADTIAGQLSVLINIFLMLVVWWSSYKLTKDCTHIDERRESSDRGLLSAVGYEKKHLEEPEEVEEPETDPKKQNLGWWDRYLAHKKKQELKPHTPGTTIIYFSMAALPIFGLGQSLIPTADASRRSFTFELAAVYVGCSLGLLLTTSFLGVRRYLRQRNLSMPKSMTGIWLGLGAALIVGFIVIAAFLPRPYSETPLVKLDFLKSTDRQASKNAMNRDGNAGKGEGKTGNQTKAGDGKATAKKGDPGGSGKDGDSKQGKGEKDDKNGNNSDKGKESNDQGGNGKDSESKKSDSKAKNSKDKQANDKNDAKGRPTEDKTKDDSDDSPKSSQESNKDSAQQFDSSQLGKAVQTVAQLLKWLVFAAIALLVIFAVAYVFLKKLAPFTDWARKLLAMIQAFLARFRRGETADPQRDERAEEEVPRITFAQFSNPFEDGSARSKNSASLIRYTFTALEAWAGDRDAERQPNETPLEFADRLQEAFPDVEPEAQKLAILLARLEYAEGNLPPNSKEALRKVWERMSTSS